MELQACLMQLGAQCARNKNSVGVPGTVGLKYPLCRFSSFMGMTDSC